jgi:hypothetical protein
VGFWEGGTLGAEVGDDEGEGEGFALGNRDGFWLVVGAKEGFHEGCFEGKVVGLFDGEELGSVVGCALIVGCELGLKLGASVR